MQTKRTKRMLLVGSTVAFGLAAGLLLVFWYRSNTLLAQRGKHLMGGGGSTAHSHFWTDESHLGNRAGAPIPTPKTPPPWEAKATDKQRLPAGRGYIPAWVVRPPKPESSLTVPPPVAPPDPATHRPVMDNPGGVNGTRPPRPVPGVE